MYKVLVVDDEPRYRRGLANLIKDLRPGYEVFEARNGKEALDFISGNLVDIVITDVKMPIMDGLQFLEKLLDVNCHAKLVVISGYAHFEYAQKAIGLGAFDYILKPVDEEKIEKMLAKIEKVLDQELIDIKNRESLKKQLNTTLASHIDHLMGRWAKGYPDIQGLQEIEKLFPFKGTGVVAFIDMGEYKTVALRYNSEEFAEIKQNIKNWAFELLRPVGDLVSFFPESDRFVLISVLNTMDDFNMREVSRRFEELADNLNMDYGFYATIGLSGKSGNIFGEIVKAFEQAQALMEYKFYFKSGSIIHYPDVAFSPYRQYFIRYKEEDDLIEAARSSESGNLTTAMETIISRMTSGGYPRPRQFIDNITGILLNLIKTLQNMLPEEHRNELTAFIEELSDCAEFGAFKQKVDMILSEVIKMLGYSRDKKSEAIIKECLSYIEEHYMEDITLELLAKKFYFNASYFCSFFKSCTGTTLSEYLSKIRMKKAQSLLETSNYKIYDIAKRVGYKDVKYFGRIFKREFGVTPDEYRRNFIRTTAKTL